MKSSTKARAPKLRRTFKVALWNIKESVNIQNTLTALKMQMKETDNPDGEGASDDSDDQEASTARVPGRATDSINLPVPRILTTTPERYPPLTPDEVSALPPRYAAYVRGGLIVNDLWSRAELTATQPVSVPCDFGDSCYGECTSLFDSYMSFREYFPEKIKRYRRSN